MEPSPAIPVTPEVSDGAANCVDGMLVAVGSSIEGGGTAPHIPEAIAHAARPLPPLAGGTLLALADGTTLAASDADRDRVYLIDTSRTSGVTELALNVGDEPGRLTQDAAGRVHVALRRGGALATLDLASGSWSDRRAVCPAPRGLAYRKATDELVVACAGGELMWLPAAAGAATRTLLLEPDLRDVVVGADGSLLVSTFRKAEVLVIGTDGQLTQRLRPGSGPVTTLFGVSQRTPAVGWRMVPLEAAASSVLLLHQTGVTDTVDTGPGGYASVSGCGAIVQPALSVLAPGRMSPAVASGLQNLPLAIDVALSPDHLKVALAVPGNGGAQGPGLLEESLQIATASQRLPCSEAPNDLERQPPGQVIAVTYSNAGVLFAQTREPAAIWRSDTGEVTTLAQDSSFDTGHLLFHANTGGGLTCASCHPEGGEDGRVWNFVCAGPRRTQSLRGGLSATVPFHWDGSEVDMARLVQDVFTGRMAGPLLDDQHQEALKSWLDTVPELPRAGWFDASKSARGQVLFDSAALGCATCHAGQHLTNNATLDVGTGRALQVPSLRGLAWRAPFMHDGCAPTLLARFTDSRCGGGDLHGSTSPLSRSELEDVVAFLESL